VWKTEIFVDRNGVMFNVVMIMRSLIVVNKDNFLETVMMIFANKILCQSIDLG
jgi:hypothetical protein